MKALLSWFIFFILLFGGLSVFTHTGLSANPTRIVVAFDDSYYMKEVWPKIVSRLKPYIGRPYTEYFVLSNKTRISQEWEGELNLEKFSQTRLFLDEFPVETLVDKNTYPELAQADLILVFTTSAKASSLKTGSNVEVIGL